MHQKIKDKLKDKNAMNGSVEYVIYFCLTVLLVIIFLEIILAFHSVYTANVTATNVARVVSISGGFDTTTDNNITDSNDIYNMAYNQLENKLHKDHKDSLVIEIFDPATNEIYQTLTYEQQSATYKVNLGEEFGVRIKGKIALCTAFGNEISTEISTASTGVGEVYHKAGS